MMLFGGNLTGFQHAPKPKPKEEASHQPTEATPHTDLISRLTDHEQRLLDELERTRSKLTTEWKLKAQDMQTKGFELPLDKLCVISNQEDQPAIPRRRKQLKRASPGSTEPTKPPPIVLRHSFDILPILTNSGETPFEVGLGKPAGQHILPVFKLPPVSRLQSSVSIDLLSHRSEGEEVKATVEVTGSGADDGMTDAERLEAMQVLGWSADELAEVEFAAPLSVDAKMSTGSIAMTVTPQRETKKPKRSGQKRNGYKQEETTSDVLRGQLQSALQNVQAYTSMVKRDIAIAQKICPVQSIRGDMFVKKWGLEKLQTICNQILYARLHSAFDRWRFVIVWMKQQEARNALMHFRGTKKLNLFFTNWTKRRLASAWEKWMADINAEKALEQASVELEAVLCLQRSWRAFTKRRLYTLIRKQKRDKRRNDAACTIQALCRGRFARQTAAKILRDLRRGLAATRIQARMRGVLTRESLIATKKLYEHNKAAAKLQALHRGRYDRRRVVQIRRDRARHKAATVIQRRYRGRLRNAKQIRMMIDREKRRQAIKIQALYRGVRGRREVVRIHDKRMNAAHKRDRSAIKIQSVYRGHRGRLGTQLKMAERRAYLKMRTDAATTIQTLFRSRRAKQTVLAFKVARLNDLVAQAREWGQFWSEDANTYFFYNAMTGEAIWEPPDTGYTKVDGMLVLSDGSVIPDPSLQTETDDTKIEEEENEVDEADAMCIECEETEATRRCLQCEDVFCDACYEKTHGTGKRATHTWKAMGPVKCIECEKLKATRWCEQCGDPYCMGCFSIIHAKGNKALHTWKEMTKNGKIVDNGIEDPQTYHEFLQSNEYNYINEGISHQEEVPLDSYGTDTIEYPPEEYAYNESTEEAYYATTQEEEASSDWVAVVDEESGELYYYNAATGETQWAQ